ncbi:hypothetical protein HHX47_DHR8000307 [Lentinula edodes]|nr:hypothetical protein HHX47_DHR8000307 [Lentinula edodes]
MASQEGEDRTTAPDKRIARYDQYPALAEVLREINRGVGGLTLNRNPPVADPKLFFYSRVGIQDKLDVENAKDVPDEGFIADLEAAMQYIAEDHSQNLTEYNLMTSQQEITYELLWALIPPNTLVYHYHQYTEQPQILLAKEVNYYYPTNRPYYADVVCDIISNDGNFFGLAQVTLEIETFTGARVIQDLPVFPLSFHKDASELRQHALKRGRKFVSMNDYTYHEISGPVIQERITQQEEVKWYKINSYGRVMIDPVAFRRFEPNRKFNSSVYRRLDRSVITDEQFMICNPVVYGFCFGIKKWGGFAMDRLQDIEWSDDLFNFLVLGQKQKMLISALVRQHVTDDNQFDDFVQGKGKGLVGLLSGRPGCGKTLTAEAIAEKTHRALYVVSAGELGTHPKEVDERLTLILQLAQTWHAVLLLDEAEVFLQRRDFTDLARNALVSIFLRQLEYYHGVLILTTNMINHIDPAFESRIHFSIQYPDLDFDARKLIWKTFFTKVMDQSNFISPEDLDRLAGYQLNGRQIKNMVGSAQAIALDRNAPLTVEHVDTVLDVVNSWNSESSMSSEHLLDVGSSQSKENGQIEEDLLF